jgi:hypothetical protein
MKIAKIIFSDVELTNKNTCYSMRRIIEHDLTGLPQELSSIGFCELGHAIITRGSTKETSHTIFIPVIDSQNPENRMSLPFLHQAIRSALTLAKIYEVKGIVVELPSWKEEKTIYNIKSWGVSLKKMTKPPINRDNVKSVINSVSKEYPGIMIRMEYLP